jgi:hypothetical protein
MTPEERQLISGLFDRMRSFGSPEKDREAEALITEAVRALPDAPYMLVQSVLVQEQALQQAGDRIEALEEQVRKGQGAGQAAGSGSFLGGLFGGGRAESRGASVPAIGARATPSVYDGARTPPVQHATPLQAAPSPQAAGGGGSFLRTAMATAVGVAGGMLAAGAIRDMLGGGSAQANPASNAAPTPASTAEPAPAPAEQTQADAQAQPDASHSDAGWDDGGLGDFGGDIEI